VQESPGFSRGQCQLVDDLPDLFNICQRLGQVLGIVIRYVSFFEIEDPQCLKNAVAKDLAEILKPIGFILKTTVKPANA